MTSRDIGKDTSASEYGTSGYIYRRMNKGLRNMCRPEIPKNQLLRFENAFRQSIER